MLTLAHPTDYQGESVLESFGASTPLFTLSDLKDEYAANYASIEEYAAQQFNSGSNSTFVINAKDTFKDEYNGFNKDQSFIAYKASSLAIYGRIGFSIPQTYSSNNIPLKTVNIIRLAQLNDDNDNYHIVISRDGD